ncbi:hypothetical protein Leryth_025796 [Lithospermum erythrorhizon]|nr:hypothetical protein Leryth_025796 [Lithospermum erythrorhizon]
MSSNSDSTWNLLPFQISSSPSQKANDTLFQGNSSQMLMSQAFDTSIDSTVPNKLHQHCFFGSDIGAAGAEKQEQSSMRPFFDEWPTSREVWSNLVDEASNKNTFSTTQLSISTPVPPSEFASRDLCERLRYRITCQVFGIGQLATVD